VRVLVVEDDPLLGPLVQKGLRQQRLAVDLVATVHEAIDATSATSYDVVCLDLGLPDGDGLDLCRRLRGGDPHLHRPHRILALTARDAVADRVAGLDAGADDYLVKPFDFTELVARVRALGRRADRPTTVVSVGDVTVDEVTHRATRAGRDLGLTAKEFTVLRYLAVHAGELVSAEELLEHCWDAHADDLTTSVRVILSRVRRKLGPPTLIETVTGAGYRMRTAP
jgi:two-component system copper resistance phosphate regulon response regulator CusR